MTLKQKRELAVGHGQPRAAATFTWGAVDMDRLTRLRDAAPALLEALRGLLERHVDCLDREPNPEQDHEVFDARAAIAQATK